MNRIVSPLYSVWLLLLGATPAAAQLLGPPIPGYVHHIWTTQHGLPQNQVRTIVQTRDGYLWAGTGMGLVRFDGLEFTLYDVTTTPELPANWITVLHEDRDGALWIGTDFGLAVYREGVFTAQPFDVETRDNYVHAIAEDEASRLWVVAGGDVLRRDEDRWTALPLGDVEATGLLFDPDGTLWIGTTTGVIEWRGRVVRAFSARDGIPDRPGWIRPLYVDRAGRLWIHTFPSLLFLDRTTGVIERAPGTLGPVSVEAILEDRDGQVWRGGVGGLLTYRRDGQPTVYPLPEPEGNVISLAQDRDGQLWFGVSGGRGGLHRLTPERVSVTAREQGLPCENVAALTEGADGTIWTGGLCPEDGGLFAIRGEEIRREAQGAALGLPAALLAEADGSLWMGTFYGELVHLANGRVARYTVADSELAGEHVKALHRGEAGALWIGTEGGLNRLDNGRWTTFRTGDGLVDNDVRFITSDREGTVWIGTRGGISRYAAGTFTNLTTEDGLAPGAVRAIHIDEEDTVWIGTYAGGLCRLKAGEIACFGTQGGLLDASVHRILEDDHGYLWMSGDRGIRRVSRRELDDFAEGRVRRLSVMIFDEHDGMANAEANGMAQPAGWKMRDGTLWFPTQGGLVQIDPATAERAASPPPVIIEELLVSGTAYDPRGAIAVPPGATDLEIRYTAPAFTRPDQIQFRYRLEGHDEGWVNADTRRVAHYTNLAPGAYSFRVVARSSAGVWNEEGAHAAFVLQPHLYQRPIVQALMVLLVGAVGVLAIRGRMVQLRQRTRALEAAVEARTAELTREREGLATANRQLSDAMGAVEESHAHLIAVLDQLRVGVIVVDARERVCFVGRATSGLLNGGDHGVAGRSVGDVLPVSATVMTEIRAQLRAPQRGARLTAKLAPASGQRYWTEIEVRVDPRDEGHRILYLYDVTEAFELKRSADRDGAGAIGGLIGSSGPMRLVHAQIQTMAGVDATVLIEGETGTGKELVARSIHEASERRGRRFVAINCAGLTESLLASQLFGHRRGAFTGAVTDHVGLFEAAQGGTLLLDEIGDMAMSMQTHLLRVLQEREIIRVGDSRPRPIDVRVLASTHRSLELEVAEGRFREDLLYRIRVARILLPPLRQRTEDIPQLATVFLNQVAAANGKAVKGVSREAMDRLLRHRWPGNVRELRSTIEWAVIRASGPVVKLSDLPPELSSDGVPAARPSISRTEQQRLIETLQRAGGNRSVAARLLGVSRATLYRRLAALEDLPSEESRP